MADLAPLLFREQGCILSAGGEGAEYAADIRLREREYSSGWKTRRSLALEVRFWPAGEGAGREDIPLAAGRVLSLGDESFASSGTAGRMLNLGIKKAAAALRNKEGR
jgi:hypothetical protein